MWIRRASGEVNASCGEFHDEEQVVRDEAAFRPDLDGREIDGAQSLPVGFQECSPSCLSFAIGSGFDAVGLQNVADGPIRDLVAEIGQSALDFVVSLGGKM